MKEKKVQKIFCISAIFAPDLNVQYKSYLHLTLFEMFSAGTWPGPGRAEVNAGIIQIFPRFYEDWVESEWPNLSLLKLRAGKWYLRIVKLMVFNWEWKGNLGPVKRWLCGRLDDFIFSTRTERGLCKLETQTRGIHLENIRIFTGL